MGRNLKGCFSHDSDEWATPQALFDELNDEFHFDLDVCATDENHKCAEYFTKEADGLKFSWGGGECFAIRLTAKFVNGWKKRSTKRNKKTHW